MDIYVPKYACPKRPQGIIPPSPPAEYREVRRKEIFRILRTCRGTMPPVSLPGYDENRRVIVPGMPGYQETLERAICMPAGSACVMGGIPPNPTSQLALDARVYYKLEDLTDSTVNGSTLTNNNAATVVAGKLGNCFAFVSSSSQFLSCNSNNFNKYPGSGSMTFRVWFFPTSVSQDNPVFSKRASGAEDYQFRGPASNGVPQWYVAGLTTGALVAWGGTILINTWHYAILEYDAVTPVTAINIDNGTRVTLACTGSPSTSATSFKIGRTMASEYYDGHVDSFAKLDRLMTAGEKAADWNSGNGVDWF